MTARRSGGPSVTRAARALALAGAAFAAFALVGCAGDAPPAPQVGRACDPGALRLTRTNVTPLPGVPSDVAADRTGAWVVLRDRGELQRVDLRTARLRGPAIHVGRTPIAVALGFGSAWVADRDASRLVSVIEASGRRQRVAPRVDVPTDVAVGAGFVWVTSLDDGYVGRVVPDPPQLGATPFVPGRVASRVAVGGDTVWVAATADRNLARVDPASGRLVGDPVDPQLRSITALAAGPGVVWAADAVGSALRRVARKATWVPDVRVSTGFVPRDVALGECALFVAAADGSVHVLDQATGEELVPPVRVGVSSGSVAVWTDTLWVTDPRARKLVRLRIGR